MVKQKEKVILTMTNYIEENFYKIKAKAQAKAPPAI
jgi:hypothetical protein